MVWSSREEWKGSGTRAVRLWDNGECEQGTAATYQPVHSGQEEEHQSIQHEITGILQTSPLCTSLLSCILIISADFR